jgi:type II secretory pathway pseudopilin PulG
MNKRRNQSGHRRKGWTLLETMVAHGLLALIMTLTALLFAALSRAERNAVRAGAAQRSLARLDELFRRDVHQALSVELVGQPQELRLTLSPHESVKYLVEQGNLQRFASEQGGSHHETFRLPGAEWEMELTEGKSSKVILRCRQPADTATKIPAEFLPRRELRFEAIRPFPRNRTATAEGES